LLSPTIFIFDVEFPREGIGETFKSTPAFILERTVSAFFGNTDGIVTKLSVYFVVKVDVRQGSSFEIS
jgi:hypothetical protein